MSFPALTKTMINFDICNASAVVNALTKLSDRESILLLEKYDTLCVGKTLCFRSPVHHFVPAFESQGSHGDLVGSFGQQIFCNKDNKKTIIFLIRNG